MAGPTPIEPANVKSERWLNFRTGDQHKGQDLHFVSLSGNADAHLQGKNKDWHTLEVPIRVSIASPFNSIPIPQPPDYERSYRPVFMIREWKAYAGLNAVYNEGKSDNNGQAVGLPAKMDASLVKTNGGDSYRKVMLQASDDDLVLYCKMSVRDSDAYLYLVAYQLDMLVCFAGYAERA